MRFTQKIKYNLKHAIPMLAIAGAGLMASCDKDETAHDIELQFSNADYSQVSMENLRKLAQDPSIANIYMKVIDNNDYSDCWEPHLNALRHSMASKMNISPNKIYGRGNFNFPIGVCTKEDSLWFVSKGWTINQHLQNQK